MGFNDKLRYLYGILYSQTCLQRSSVLGWPPFKMCPVILTSNQDGHQAKNRKKGG
jgi:hypothetical protein